VGMKNTIFWNINPRRPLEANWCLGETYHLCLQGRRVG
jgi:hypothetical protein